MWAKMLSSAWCSTKVTLFMVILVILIYIALSIMVYSILLYAVKDGKLDSFHRHDHLIVFFIVGADYMHAAFA